MSSDRREERVTINKEFESFDQFIQEYVTNISRSGAFVRSKQLHVTDHHHRLYQMVCGVFQILVFGFLFLSLFLLFRVQLPF